MNLVIDAGNTRTKIGIFERETLRESRIFDHSKDVRQFLQQQVADHMLLSTVTEAGDELTTLAAVRGQRLKLTPSLALPLENRYATPGTLGMDRLAAACGAWQIFPNQSTLVVDCGSCINYEFVHEKGYYVGGAISPGVTMRFRAMHDQTDRLPLASPGDTPLTGSDTLECLRSGVMHGTLEEIKGILRRYAEDHPGLRVILTGGDAHFFEKPLKPHIFVAPELVLIGLNSILLHHVTP